MNDNPLILSSNWIQHKLLGYFNNTAATCSVITKYIFSCDNNCCNIYKILYMVCSKKCINHGWSIFLLQVEWCETMLSHNAEDLWAAVVSYIGVTGEHALKSKAWQVYQAVQHGLLISDISPLTALVSSFNGFFSTAGRKTADRHS